MLQSPIATTPTERVVARLKSEGWVDCPGLGFPALCQLTIPDLRKFILERLQHEGNRMWATDLQLATLVFSIPAHEFQFHPGLEPIFKQLEAEQVIEIHEFQKPGRRKQTPQRCILLKAPYLHYSPSWSRGA